ncbi:head GIN domain-containing protein [Plebeiibacterium marinum]|uniref:DUF2807 domain-containing protein n=1 Tax=Plebeiibacterium marinum TaxID=2992111 RepID=A0AAE3SLF2_9BACT|nr:head GIN domain-containing protein [Plebeiobacterium marinum]MCW3806485.1 DUF2807 domain-containing protein [Plebeiobacterium marinum]
MRKSLVTLLMVAITATSIFAQEKEVRETQSFNSLSASSGIDVYITQGNEFNVIVESQKSSIHRIITEVKDETLHIYVKGRFKWSSRDVKKVHVTAPEFKRISASGGADIRGVGGMEENNLTLISSGGADIYLTTKTHDIKLVCSGGSDISVKGESVNIDATCSGGSDIDAGKLVAKNVNVSCSGGSDAYVNATEELKATASGGSDVHYRGTPPNIKINKSGGGDVRRF